MRPLANMFNFSTKCYQQFADHGFINIIMVHNIIIRILKRSVMFNVVYYSLGYCDTYYVRSMWKAAF